MHINKFMKKIIAVTGTHGTGKTTLTFQLAYHYKQEGANVKIIQEVARACPFPLNKEMTFETALWIFYEHSRKELEASKDHDIVICDRTSFDSFVYASYLNIDIPLGLEKHAKDNLKYYNDIYFVRPSLTAKIIEDGIRSTDLDFQYEIDRLFFKHMKSINPIMINSNQIFDEGQSWKQFLS